MRTFAELKLLVTEDDAQEQKVIDQLLTFDDSVLSSVAEFGYRTLAASASDQAFAFGGVTRASTVLIVAFQAVTVKLDGTGSPAIPVRPVPADTTGSPLSLFQELDQPGVMLWRGRVSSIHLGNPSDSATARVFVAVIGDAAA